MDIFEDFHKFFSGREGLTVFIELIKEHHCSTLKQAIEIAKQQYTLAYKASVQ